MNLTTRWRAALAIIVALSMALTITVSTAPDSDAQEDTQVSGVIQAGEKALEGVTLTNSITSTVSGPDGEFTIEALPGLDDVSVGSTQTLANPEFDLIGGLDFDQSPLVIELPEIVEVEFTIEGGFYRDCTIDEALEETCPTDEFFCTIDDALAGICDEVFLEIRSEVNTPELAGQWSAVGESQDNSLILPIFNEPGVMIYAFTVDAAVEEFAWNGTSNQTLTMSGPVLQDWYPDFDIDGYGDQFAEPVSAAFSPGPEFVLDNTDCDDGDTLINPGAEDIPGNRIDEDCDGFDAEVPAQLELRFDVVRENGEVCPESFDLATPGPGEPLLIDEGEEVTYCFWLFNDSALPLTGRTLESIEAGILLTSLPDVGAGETSLVATDGFVPPGVNIINAYADGIVGDMLAIAIDDAIVDVVLPPLPELDLRFDVVRENGEVCADSFDAAVEGPGQPLSIDEGEEVTYCFWLFNPGIETITDLSVKNPNIGIDRTLLPDLLPGESLLFASDGFVPEGVSNILSFANGLAGDIPVGDADEAIVVVGPPQLSAIDFRFDIVRENGEVCPDSFDQFTPGPGEPLVIDEGEEVTFCFAVLNSGETSLDVLVGSDDAGIDQIGVGLLEPGVEAIAAIDGYVDPGFIEIQAWAAGFSDDILVTAADSALVDSIVLPPMPISLSIDVYEITDADEILDVAVTLDPGFGIPVSAVEFSISYDPAVITPVLNEDPRDGFVGSPMCTGAGVGCGPPNPNGLIMIVVYRGAPFSGAPIDFVNIPFRAVGDGVTELRLEIVEVIDENFGIIDDVISIDGAVSVQLPPPPPPVPMCAGLPVTIDMRTGASGIGTSLDDVIMGTSGADLIEGRGGNDVICALGGDDEVKAGAGNDLVYGGGGNDIIKGGSGDDELRGGSGLDVIRGNSGFDAIYGGTDDDRLWGDSDGDQLRGGPGNDELRGGSGEDDLRGGSGSDSIWGGRDADQLYGNTDDDRLRGGSGDDAHFGGSGFDVCIDRSGSNSFGACEADRVPAVAAAGPA